MVYIVSHFRGAQASDIGRLHAPRYSKRIYPAALGRPEAVEILAYHRESLTQ